MIAPSREMCQRNPDMLCLPPDVQDLRRGSLLTGLQYSLDEVFQAIGSIIYCLHDSGAAQGSV